MFLLLEFVRQLFYEVQIPNRGIFWRPLCHQIVLLFKTSPCFSLYFLPLLLLWLFLFFSLCFCLSFCATLPSWVFWFSPSLLGFIEISSTMAVTGGQYVSWCLTLTFHPMLGAGELSVKIPYMLLLEVPEHAHKHHCSSNCSSLFGFSFLRFLFGGGWVSSFSCLLICCYCAIGCEISSTLLSGHLSIAFSLT